MGDIEKEVLAAADRRYKAMTDKDYAALDRIFADTLCYTHSTGRSENKAEYMGMLTSGKLTYVKATRESCDMAVYGDTVVSWGKIALQVLVGGEIKHINSMCLNVWVKGADGWKMVAWASTPMPMV